MATATSAPPRSRIRHRVRIDARLATGLVLLAASVLGGLRLFALADTTVPVVVAARDLPANHVVAAGDFTITRIRATPTVLHGLVAGEDVSHLIGRVLLAPVGRHELVAVGALGRAPRAGREITVPVAPEHALGGDLRIGDRVDVLATYGKGTDGARTLTVVRGAEIVGVRRANSVFGSGAHDVTAVTVSVAPDDAVALAFAIRNGELDVVRATGSAPATRERFDLTDVEGAG